MCCTRVDNGHGDFISQMPNVNLSFSRKNSPHPFFEKKKGTERTPCAHHHHPTPPPLRSEFHQSQPILRRISQTNTLLAFHSFFTFATILFLKNEAIFMIYDVLHQILNLQHYMNDRLLDSTVDLDSTCVYQF